MLLFVLTSIFVSSIVGTSYSFLRRILGTLHSTKTSGLNFWQLPVASGTAFSGISKKEGNLTRYTQIFEKFFSQKFSFHSTLLPKFLEFSIERIAFRISTVSAISGNFFGKFLYHLPLFPNVRKFLLNGKRLWFIVFPPSLPLHFYSFPSSVLSFLLFSLLVLTSIFIFSLLLCCCCCCCCSSLSSFLFFLILLLLYFNVSSPPLLIFFVFPPPPPPHFYCFPSTTTTATFHYLFRHPHQTGYMEGQKAKKIKKKIRNDFLAILCWKL